MARNVPQELRQRDHIDAERAHGFTEDEIRIMTAEETRTHVNATNIRSGIHFAPAAALDPARLVRGLADACRRRGVEIHERTPVIAVEPGRVVTSRCTVRSPIVVRGLEGYTRNLPGHRRSMVPLYSLMVATEPLDDSVFDEIGLSGRPTFADDRYAVIYGQRTEDNRIAFGGRGVPYVFGSRIRPQIERHAPTHELVERTLVDLFPVLADAKITHRWGGVLGAPRNFTPSVNFDRSTGMADAGGYVGEGVCAANLAGRTLADLLAENDSERTTLPWVNQPSRKWEPEPLRFAGVWGTRRVMLGADTKEFATDKESKLGLLASKLL
jgi:glycine/D-amino acid oxidase-like deaminating enzyme